MRAYAPNFGEKPRRYPPLFSPPLLPICAGPDVCTLVYRANEEGVVEEGRGGGEEDLEKSPSH